jgi:hypothetical protein
LQTHVLGVPAIILLAHRLCSTDSVSHSTTSH